MKMPMTVPTTKPTADPSVPISTPLTSTCRVDLTTPGSCPALSSVDSAPVA